MEPPEKKQNVTKEEGAKIQIEAAIEALEKGNYAVAITLAGAAEGMLESDGKDVFEALKKAPDVPDMKKWIATLNGERDWLKHVTKDDPRKVLELSRLDAGFIIARAASKLEVWESPKIEEFKTWFLRAIVTDIVKNRE